MDILNKYLPLHANNNQVLTNIHPKINQTTVFAPLWGMFNYTTHMNEYNRNNHNPGKNECEKRNFPNHNIHDSSHRIIVAISVKEATKTVMNKILFKK